MKLTNQNLVNELLQFEVELKKVESSNLEYLPEYGYSPKEEIIQLIKEEISNIDMNLQLETSDISSEYTEKNLEEERTNLCLSQGLSRYC
ncbi:hypothetical protein [Bacteroides fragilis]|uniref:hypothetical protein n=1 Tax=Bacteroides fragilis TaxID=817 RepID=UPI0032198EF5